MNKCQSDMGSGCGSVGRAVASDSRGPRFESSHWQKFNVGRLRSTVFKDENKEKRARDWPIFIKKLDEDDGNDDNDDKRVRKLVRNFFSKNFENAFFLFLLYTLSP